MGLQDTLKTLDTRDSEIKELTDEQLKHIQNMLYDIVDDFDRVCTENNIEWCLAGGSVIGAVRHDGFIPWDDDIDVFMTRENFNKFKEIFQSTMSDKYELKVPGTKDYLYHFPQIHLKNTLIEPLQTSDTAKDGLFIDIFILENAYDNKLMYTIHGILDTFLLFVDSAIRMKKCKNHILKYCNNDKNVKKEIDKRANWAWLFSFMSFEKWLAFSDKCFAMQKNNNSKTITCPSGRGHYFNETYERTKMCTLKKHIFVDKMWNIPADAAYYLEMRYGKNYMTVPPVEKREKHAYIKIELE